MKPHNPEPNQGEGDKISARRYNRQLRTFVAEGKVEEAAREAKAYVERDPAGAARAEEAARRGPRGTRVTVDELIAKGRSIVERIRPMFDRVASRVRARLGRH
jgi:hypothetical protein